MIEIPNTDPRRGARLRTDRGFYTIREVAAAALIPPTTLSWYITEGYIPAPRVVATRKRRYYTAMQAEDIVNRLGNRKKD